MNSSCCEERRKELYRLLGRLPERNAPVSCRVVEVVEKESYLLEKLVLTIQTSNADSPRCEPIPAYFTRPKGEGPFPAVLFSHSHGGQYHLGKDELLSPSSYMYKTCYAEALAAQGIAALAIDHWCFGERSGRSELSCFKAMLWDGEVMWGRMVYDSLKALDYLCSRTDVDAKRIGTLGMSMGSTMSWWTAALDERVKVCVDIHCLSDYDELLRENGLDRHGIYYFVPCLHRHFTTAQINALIAPRAHLSTIGLYDALTPQAGVDRIEGELKQIYANLGFPDRISILRYPVGHRETAEARADILAFLGRQL